MSNIVKNIPEQLGFDIFTAVREELGPNTAITESTREIGYRKTNVLIDVTSLSLLARRAINALWLEVSQKPHQDHFDIELGYFKWLAKYETSNNLAHLKKALRECQSASVQVTVEGNAHTGPQWASVPLLGSVAIASGRVVFKVDDLIRRQLKDPQRYTYLSLRMSAALTNYAYILYERLSSMRFMGTTDWIPLEEVRRWVNADAVKSLTEYKQFKRLVLDKSLKQINELTDLDAEFETKNAPGTRRVAAIRFRLRPNANGKLVLDLARPHELKDLYDTLVRVFGLSTRQIGEIMANRDVYTDVRVRNAIELVKHRVKTKGSEIKSPAAYLMRAIKEGWMLSELEREAAAGPAPQIETPQLPPVHVEAVQRLDETIEKNTEAGIEAYLALDPEARTRVRDALYREVTFKLAVKRAKVKASPDEETIFARKALKVELGAFMNRKATSPRLPS